MKKITILKKSVSVILILTLLLQSCSKSPAPKSITRSGFFFDTLINITIYDTDDEALLDSCFEMCDRYEKLLSMTVDGSDIYRINEAGTEEVTVSRDTVILLEEACKYHDISDGMLDITVAPLSALWTDARSRMTPPDEEEILKLLPHVCLDKISVDTDLNTVSKEDPAAMLDTGALAKGYIADRLKELLIQKGVRSAIISLGGNIVTIGSKPDGVPFRIGIKKPFGQADEAAASLKISDMSVVTSGIYERCFTYDDKIYHHILDPYTGYPRETDLLSATIIGSSSLEGDALSTICLLYGLDKAEELINNTPGTEAVFITKDDKIHYTGGAESYIDN